MPSELVPAKLQAHEGQPQGRDTHEVGPRRLQGSQQGRGGLHSQIGMPSECVFKEALLHPTIFLCEESLQGLLERLPCTRVCGSRALRVSRRRGGMVGLFFLWASIVASEAPDGAEEDPTVPTKEELCCFKDSDVDIQCAVYNFNSLLNLQLLFRAMRCVVRSLSAVQGKERK